MPFLLLRLARLVIAHRVQNACKCAVFQIIRRAPDDRPEPQRTALRVAKPPVTHVAWRDAKAFAGWAVGRLPKDAELEHAARGGLGDVRFPWGDAVPDDHGANRQNIWQGEFPHRDTSADGYTGLAPVHAFAPNCYGLHQMVGNVWEWSNEPFRTRSASPTARRIHALARGHKLLKGGSFLCDRRYCFRYRIAARIGNTPDSASAHTWFRVVNDRPPH